MTGRAGMTRDDRTKAAAHLTKAEAHGASAAECAKRDDCARQVVTETADVWSALPLIVLAGLR